MVLEGALRVAEAMWEHPLVVSCMVEQDDKGAYTAEIGVRLRKDKYQWILLHSGSDMIKLRRMLHDVQR